MKFIQFSQAACKADHLIIKAGKRIHWQTVRQSAWHGQFVIFNLKEVIISGYNRHGDLFCIHADISPVHCIDPALIAIDGSVKVFSDLGRFPVFPFGNVPVQQGIAAKINRMFGFYSNVFINRRRVTVICQGKFLFKLKVFRQNLNSVVTRINYINLVLKRGDPGRTDKFQRTISRTSHTLDEIPFIVCPDQTILSPVY